MAAVLVDSNVPPDVMTEDAHWFSWSAASIGQPAESSRLIINSAIHAEVSNR